VNYSSTVDEESLANEAKPAEQEVTPKLTLNEHESSYLIKQRNSFWVANPKMLFTFGATPKSNIYIFGQATLLLISLSIFFAINIYAIFSYEEAVVGVGEISGQTWVDRLTIIAILFIIFRANKHLKNNVNKNPIKGYRLTLFSNSLIRALVNQIQLALLIFIVPAIYGLMVYEETSQVFSEIFDGSIADNLNILYSFTSVVIFYIAFSYCKKELVQ